MQRIKKSLIPGWKRKELRIKSREHRRWAEGWKRNATYKGQPLTRSMIRRVGSRMEAKKRGLI